METIELEVSTVNSALANIEASSVNSLTAEIAAVAGDINLDKNYYYTQTTASAVWEIHHNLNKYPSVTVIDSSGSEVVGDIEYIDQNNIKIIFNGGFTGHATLN